MTKVLLGAEEGTNQSYAIDKFSSGHKLLNFTKWMTRIIDTVNVQPETHRSNYIHPISSDGKMIHIKQMRENCDRINHNLFPKLWGISTFFFIRSKIFDILDYIMKWGLKWPPVWCITKEQTTQNGPQFCIKLNQCPAPIHVIYHSYEQQTRELSCTQLIRSTPQLFDLCDVWLFLLK